MRQKLAKDARRLYAVACFLTWAYSVGVASATAPLDVATGEALDAFVTQQGGKLANAIGHRASVGMASVSMANVICHKFNRA